MIDDNIEKKGKRKEKRKRKGNFKKNLFFITIFIKNFQNKIVIKNKFFLKI